MKTIYTEKFVLEYLRDEANEEYVLLHLDEKGTKKHRRQIQVKHAACNHIYAADMYEFLEGKRRCPKCKGAVLRKHFASSIEEIREKTQELTDGEYSFESDTYINSKTYYTFKHRTCGTIFEKRWEKFKEGQRCPTCSRRGMESVASRYVRDVLDHYGISYDQEKYFEDCTNHDTGRMLPFDYYIPEAPCLIEVDGEQHVRPSFGKNAWETIQIRDRIKDDYAQANSIVLFRIPASRWEYLPEELVPIVSYILGQQISTQEIAKIRQSSHPERINADLKSFNDGRFQLYDQFYTGVDRKHRFVHNVCGTVFTTTYERLRKLKYPCPQCRAKITARKNHAKSNRLLIEKTKGKYSLDLAEIYKDGKGRNLVICHTCGHRWYSHTGNIRSSNGGCPVCYQRRRSQHHK